MKDKWKGAATEIEQRYDDWPEGEGFGSSDHNFAIKELMELVGYEFDDKDTSGRFVVTKQPVEIEKAGIKNARMKDAMPTEDGSSYTSMNKYGLSAREHKGKFYSYRHGKLTGAFDSMQDLAKHQEELIKDESVSEDAGEGHMSKSTLYTTAIHRAPPPTVVNQMITGMSITPSMGHGNGVTGQAVRADMLICRIERIHSNEFTLFCKQFMSPSGQCLMITKHELIRSISISLEARRPCLH